MAQIPLTFKIFQGDELVREETLTQDIIKIGKLESSHLRIEDDDVSRMHAVIEVTGPGEIHVIDLGSAKGTMVNGQKVNKCQVNDGDELMLGGTKIIIGVGAAAEDQAAAAAPVEVPAVPAPVPGVGPVPGVVPSMPAMAPPPGVMPPPGMALPPGMAPPAQAAPAPEPAYVPPVDPLLDVQDGSRAIEVTAMFQDSVLEVRHLTNPQAGKVGGLTWGLLGLGGVVTIGGLVLLVGSAFEAMHQGGIGSFVTVVGCALLVAGLGRRTREKESPHYEIGESPAARLHIKHPLPSPCFPLVQSTGNEFQLLFAETMKGDVTLGVDRTAIGELASSGRARPAGDFANAFAYPIPQDARIKVDIGDNTFLVNSVAPARRVVTPFLASINWSQQMSTGLSFAAHALLLFLIFSIPPDAKSLSLDLFNADNKFVKFLIKPPEQKEDEIPSWLKKKGPDEAGGKGKKHKGDEGKMGKKTSKKKTGLYGLKGPKDNKDLHLAKRLAEDMAQNAGVLGLLKQSSGSHLASIFGRDTALGSDTENALGGLIGNQIGEAYGVGGLGLVGTGRGGGGTGEGTIGLGTLGTIGKGGGGGSGAGYGRGAGRLGGRRARAPRVLAGRAEVRGSLDKEIIRRIIRRHLNEVKYCYQKELQAHPNLAGRVMIQFTIAATGQVVASVVQSSTLKNRKVETCVAQAVRRWLFPKPKGGGIVIVSYPFVLRSAGQ